MRGRGLIVRTIVRKCVSTDERIDVHPRMLRRIGAYLSVSARTMDRRSSIDVR